MDAHDRRPPQWTIAEAVARASFSAYVLAQPTPTVREATGVTSCPDGVINLQLSFETTDARIVVNTGLMQPEDPDPQMLALLTQGHVYKLMSDAPQQPVDFSVVASDRTVDVSGDAHVFHGIVTPGVNRWSGWAPVDDVAISIVVDGNVDLKLGVEKLKPSDPLLTE
jgi:hypothetical protein